VVMTPGRCRLSSAASALLGTDGVLGLNLALMQQANPITPEEARTVRRGENEQKDNTCDHNIIYFYILCML